MTQDDAKKLITSMADMLDDADYKKVLEDPEYVVAKMWSRYEEIKDVLRKAGLPEHRLPVRETFFAKAVKQDMAQLNLSCGWLIFFCTKEVKEWRRVRAQMSEESWQRYELFGFDASFEEVRVLRKLSKEIRSLWVNTKYNLLRRSFANAPRKKNRSGQSGKRHEKSGS